MSIAITQQNFELTEVGDVVVTPIVQDPDEGDYVRDVRFFSNDATPVLVMQIKIRSASHDALQISSPASDF